MKARRGFTGSTITAAIVLAAVLAACEGSNLFEGVVEVEGPVILDLDAVFDEPTGVDVTVEARAPGGLNEIVLTYERFPIAPDTLHFNGETGVVERTVNVDLIGILGDTILIVSARARDQGGRLSSVVTDTAFINDP